MLTSLRVRWTQWRFTVLQTPLIQYGGKRHLGFLVVINKVRQNHHFLQVHCIVLFCGLKYYIHLNNNNNNFEEYKVRYRCSYTMLP